MKKIMFFVLLFTLVIYTSLAVTINLWNWQKLASNNWTNLSSVLNKVDVNSNNININWKLAVDWKIINTTTWKALWECDADKHWDTVTNTCINNTKSCSVTNWTWSQTRTWTAWPLTCSVISCNSGYIKSWNTCVAPAWDCRYENGYGVLNHVIWRWNWTNITLNTSWTTISWAYEYKEWDHVKTSYWWWAGFHMVFINHKICRKPK